MELEVDWIRQALADDREKTQSGLARALNLDKSSVSRLLRGERRLKFAEAQLAAAYLGVDVPAGLVEDGGAYRPQDTTPKDLPATPIYRVDAGEEGLWLLDRETIAETKPRSPQLTGIPSAFGFYVPDEAMAPRFRIGEIAWVNPDRPAAPGDDALLMRKVQCGDLDQILLCEIEKIDEARFTVRQHGAGGAERSFPKDEWSAHYVFPRG